MPVAMRRAFAALLLALPATILSLDVHCPRNCTAALQAALLSGAAHVMVHPPSGGGPATIGSPEHSTRILANGTNMVVEFAPGLELAGFLNNTLYDPAKPFFNPVYNVALVTLEIQGINLTMKGKDTVLRRITSYAGRPGNNVRLEGLQFIDPGWDGMYVRGVVGLTLKDCVFVRTPSRIQLPAALCPSNLPPLCMSGSPLPERPQHHRHRGHAGRRLHLFQQPAKWHGPREPDGRSGSRAEPPDRPAAQYYVPPVQVAE